MGAEVSKTVRSRLEHSTLEELLSDDKYIEEFGKSLPVLDDNERKNLKKLLSSSRAKKPRKHQNRDTPKNFSSTVSNADLTGQDVAATEESAVSTGRDTASLGVAAAFLATTPVPPSEDATAGGDAVSSGEDPARLRPLWELQEKDIALPPEIAGSFEKWKSNPSAFLRGDCSRVPSSPREHYEYARRVQASLASNRILWRFVTTTYYDIISALSQSERYTITKEVVAFVVAVICDSSSYEREIVEMDVINWAKDGKRHRALATKLGGTGCYFFYPDISDWIWIKHLPQDSYDKAAKLLRKLGIFEKAQRSGAVDLANRIENLLRAPFQSAVPTQPHVGQWILPVMSASGERTVQDDEEGNEDTEVQRFEYVGAQQDDQPAGCPRFHQTLDHMSIIEAMDLDSPPSSIAPTPRQRALPKVAANGLVKIQWPPAVHLPCFEDLEHMLFDFYVNSICVGRTVLRDNAYLNEFLPILHSNGHSINPVLALSASYRKEYFPEGSFARKQIEHAECRYIVETAKEVREAVMRGDVGASTAVAAALLCHHATLNPSLHPCCWTKYLYPMLDPAGADVEGNLAMASVAILAMTTLPLNGNRDFQRINYTWIGCGETEQLTKVNSTLGLSRMMLYFIYSITQEATHPNEQNANRLLRAIEESSQWVDETEGDMPRYIALATAETYRLGTRLYCLTRLYGFTPEHPAVKQTCDSLLRWLYELPTEGPWYSSIHPAWCFVVACVCVRAEEHYNTLFSYLTRIAGDNKSNVDAVCPLVRRIRHWQHKEWESGIQSQESQWWERMTENVNGESVICLA